MLRFEINTTNKSISEIIQDIKNITNQNKGIYEVIIDNLNPNANKFYLSLCDQILINKLKIKWFINTIPNINYNLNFFKKIRFCGCFGIHLDIISFSDSLLRFNKCSFNSIDIKNNLRDAKNGGLNTSISFTLGKNETKNDIDLCLSEINDNSLYIDDLGRIRIKNKTSKTIKFRSQILNTAKKNNIFILN